MACVLQPARCIRVFLALLAVVLVAPFERPLIAIPGGLTLTTVEIVAIAACALIAARVGPRRLLLSVPPPLVWPGAVLLALLAAAALAAPLERANALRFVGRMMLAAALFVATVHVVDSRARARAAARAMLAVGALVAAIGLLEAAEMPYVMRALRAFRPGFHVVAGQLRATSTLFYPTIASMYLEVAFAIGLWLLIDREPSRRRWHRAVTFLALAVVAGGIAATFTRAGLLGMGSAMLLVAGLRLTRVPPARAGLGRLTALAATVAGIVFLLHSPELLATRLTTEGSQAWYGAEYRVPGTLALSPGEHRRVPVTVINRGRLVWDSTREPAFALAYHWTRSGTGDVVQFDGIRTAFPTAVPPGAAVSFEADVIAPGEPGAYTLVWDVVHESRAWLSTEGVTPAQTPVTVSGAAVASVTTAMAALPRASVVPARPQLWAAALRMSAAHPWLGVGPDNYRHSYGPYLGVPQWDHRVHANNMYLELLAGAGVPGLAALLWLVVAAGRFLWRRARAADDVAHGATLAALSVWLMIAGHGLVDSFLSFTTPYVTFAVAGGLACSPGLLAPPVPGDAHCL